MNWLQWENRNSRILLLSCKSIVFVLKVENTKRTSDYDGHLARHLPFLGQHAIFGSTAEGQNSRPCDRVQNEETSHFGICVVSLGRIHQFFRVACFLFPGDEFEMDVCGRFCWRSTEDCQTRPGNTLRGLLDVDLDAAQTERFLRDAPDRTGLYLLAFQKHTEVQPVGCICGHKDIHSIQYAWIAPIDLSFR